MKKMNGISTEYKCLLVAIDDATGIIPAKFAKNEGLIETFKFWKEYILKNGKPKSIFVIEEHLDGTIKIFRFGKYKLLTVLLKESILDLHFNK